MNEAVATQRRTPEADPTTPALDEGRLPPGPRAPVLWQTLRFVRNPVAFLERCSRRFGETVTVNLLGFGRTVWVTDPELVRYVFANDDVLPLSPSGNVIKPIFGTRGVTGIDGSEHLHRRKMLLPPFHGEAIASYQETFQAATDRMLRRWSSERKLTLHGEMYRLTMDVLFELLFGVEDDERKLALTRATQRVTDKMLTCALGEWIRRDLGPASPWGRFLRARAELDRLLYEQIDAHRRSAGSGSGRDILSLLVEARHEDGSPMSDEEIRDELVTLIVAGSETTATSLAWTFDLALHTPTAVQRIRSEAEVGESAYTDALIKESLRMRPPVIAAGRIAVEPVRLGPWTIPAGTRVWNQMQLIQRDPELFAEPNRFRPERFLEGKPPPYVWIPFGGGVRRCLGAAFALLEMRIVLQSALSRTKLRPLRPLEPPRAEGAIIVPAHGVPVENEGGRHGDEEAVSVERELASWRREPERPGAPGREAERQPHAG